MTEDHYKKMMGVFRRSPVLTAVLTAANVVTVLFVELSYVGMLLWLYIQRDVRLTRCILVPLDAFIIVSVFRYIADRKRPYEVFGTEPAIPRKKTGKSFPSRHVFSAFMITAVFWWAGAWQYGMALSVISVLIAILRVISGVHYPSDAVAGAAAGIVAGLIGFVWIP